MGARVRQRKLDYVRQLIEGYLAIIDKNLSLVKSGRGGAEPLHQLRVTLRRLRNAFWIFKKGLPKTQIRKWKTELRVASKYSGEARDLDVQILFLKKYLKNYDRNSHPSRSLDAVVDHLRKKRTAMQQRLARSLGTLQKRKTLLQIKNFFQAKPIAPILKVQKVAEKRVTKRMKKLLSFESILPYSEKKQKLHEMRIAAKHLRYTLEAFQPLWGKKTTSYIDRVTLIQRLLGIVHDQDVWLQILETMTDGSVKRRDEALVDLRAHCRRDRAEAHKKLVSLWREYQQKKFWQELAIFIKTS